MAERAGVTRATVTGLLDGLERDGFLRREADEVDRRRVQVLLSAKGKAIATKLFAEHAMDRRAVRSPVPAERKRLGGAGQGLASHGQRPRGVAGGGAMSRKAAKTPAAGRGVQDISLARRARS